MKITAAIPAYNCAKTIRATLESVLDQTLRPDEILVCDDGSTDQTRSILESYKTRICIVDGKHSGAAAARNSLTARAQGDLIAFLDSDDIWHRTYLERQSELLRSYPSAVASFTGHVNFYGPGNYSWTSDPNTAEGQAELISPRSFFQRYNTNTGTFGSMSHCCVPRWVFQKMGDQPFQTRSADDFYFLNWALLFGPVAYCPQPLAAYRIAEGSISHDRVLNYADRVKAFELLEDRYCAPPAPYRRKFKTFFAAHRRLLGKYLMGAGKKAEARAQLRRALTTSADAESLAKSLFMLARTYLPPSLQPAWPNRYRNSDSKVQYRNRLPA